VEMPICCEQSSKVEKRGAWGYEKSILNLAIFIVK
jgi:hypothetical protein